CRGIFKRSVREHLAFSNWQMLGAKCQMLSSSLTSSELPMFTGIIEEVGRIARIEQRGENRHITVDAKHAPRELHTGDRIDVSGVCLTARDIKVKSFAADLAPGT